jgi:5-methylcytosine-specific restriction endonuclease McrA
MSDTLLLNADYNPISVLPLSVIDYRHAIKLMCLGRVTVLETYPDWLLHSEHMTINVPSVCVTKDYFHYKKRVKFSRYNLYLRDLFQCQYCGDTFDFDDLTIDHVTPRAAGGRTTWENCTTACKACNHRKGSKTNIKPMRMPYSPDYFNLVSKWKDTDFTVKQESWYKYLGVTRPGLASAHILDVA